MMKKKSLFILFIAILTIEFSCKKDERRKYIGEWKFTTVIDKFNFDGETGTETIVYIGNIKEDETENRLFIKYTNEDTLTVRINNLGEIYSVPEYNQPNKLGEFYDKNTVKLTREWGNEKGISKWHTINGIKTK